uniref:Putative LOV domain-containing protein n=1 Tax=Cymbomonas sp. BC-2016 TaxID=1799572 RepID=A0A126X3M3_9CHLO|nr:putative LOV domain-containing protein [Cymbomonas sp. BC-2016]
MVDSDELQALLNNPSLAFVVSDARLPDLPIVYASQGFYDVTGFSDQEVLGQNCRFLQGPGTEKNKVMEIRDAIREEREVTVQLLNYHKDKTPFQNIFHLAPVRDQSSGHVAYYIGVQMKVEESSTDMEADKEEVLQKQRYSTLLEAPETSKAEVLALRSALSNGRLSSTAPASTTASVASSSNVNSNLLRALNKVGQSFVLSDPNLPDTPIVHASQAFLDMTGYSAAETLGRNCRFLQGPDTDPAASQKLGQAVREHKSCTTRILNYKKDGTPFWNYIHISPVRDALGKVVFFVGVQYEMQSPCQGPGAAGLEVMRDEEQGSDSLRPTDPNAAKTHKGAVGQVRIAVRSLACGGLKKSPATLSPQVATS